MSRPQIANIFWPERCSHSPSGFLNILDHVASAAEFAALRVHCAGSPKILGEWSLQSSDGSERGHSKKDDALVKEMKQHSDIWLHLQGDARGIPILREIRCCGYRHRAVSEVIFYKEPSPDDWLAAEPLSLDIIGSHTELDYTLRQINLSGMLESLLADALEEPEDFCRCALGGRWFCARPTLESVASDDSAATTQNSVDNGAGAVLPESALSPDQSGIVTAGRGTPTGTGSRSHGSGHVNVQDSEAARMPRLSGDEETLPALLSRVARHHRRHLRRQEAEAHKRNKNSTGFVRVLLRTAFQRLRNVWAMLVRLVVTLLQFIVLPIQAAAEALLWLLNLRAEWLVSLEDTSSSSSSSSSSTHPVEDQYAIKHIGFSTTQLDGRLREISEWPTKYLVVRHIGRHSNFGCAMSVNFYNSVWLAVDDVVLGILAGAFILSHQQQALEWVEWSGSILHHGVVEEQIKWLMGWPAGFKLNDNLDLFFGHVFLYCLRQWQWVLTLLVPFIPTLIQCYAYMGLFGLSMMFAVAADVVSLLSLNLFYFYRIIARIYSAQVYMMKSFYWLFRGKKRNVLRHRIDSCDYDLGQLLLGTLLFTINAFLFPTTVAYYLFFVMDRLVIIAIRSFIALCLALLNNFPLYAILLHFAGTARLPGGVTIDALQPDSFVMTPMGIVPAPARRSRVKVMLREAFASVFALLRPIFWRRLFWSKPSNPRTSPAHDQSPPLLNPHASSSTPSLQLQPPHPSLPHSVSDQLGGASAGAEGVSLLEPDFSLQPPRARRRTGAGAGPDTGGRLFPSSASHSHLLRHVRQQEKERDGLLGLGTGTSASGSDSTRTGAGGLRMTVPKPKPNHARSSSWDAGPAGFEDSPSLTPAMNYKTPAEKQTFSRVTRGSQKRPPPALPACFRLTMMPLPFPKIFFHYEELLKNVLRHYTGRQLIQSLMRGDNVFPMPPLRVPVVHHVRSVPKPLLDWRLFIRRQWRSFVLRYWRQSPPRHGSSPPATSTTAPPTTTHSTPADVDQRLHHHHTTTTEAGRPDHEHPIADPVPAVSLPRSPLATRHAAMGSSDDDVDAVGDDDGQSSSDGDVFELDRFRTLAGGGAGAAQQTGGWAFG